MNPRDSLPTRSDATPLKVLYLDNSFTFGGAIASLEHLVRGLSDRGIEPVVVSGQPEEELSEAFPSAETISVDVEVPLRHPTPLLRYFRTNPPNSETLARIGLRLGAADWHLRRTLPAAVEYMRIGRRRGVDLVHLNNILEGQLDGLLAAKLLGVPCVAHAQGFQTPGRLLGAAARQVDHHCAISRAIKKNLEEIGAPTDQISVIHHGVDIDRFAPPQDTSGLRDSLGIPSTAPAFGLFGRVVEWKGTREFVHAATRVLNQIESARALVVGDVSDGSEDYFDEVRELARTTNVSDRIIFTGYREDVPALMQALDVVVHTSIEPEPFGMVVAEAMAAGTAVVAADSGGPLDIVVDGETGLLVDPSSAEELAAAIARLLSNPEEARSMGEAGRVRAERKFSHERFADDVIEVYQNILSDEAL